MVVRTCQVIFPHDIQQDLWIVLKGKLVTDKVGIAYRVTKDLKDIVTNDPSRDKALFNDIVEGTLVTDSKSQEWLAVKRKVTAVAPQVSRDRTLDCPGTHGLRTFLTPNKFYSCSICGWAQPRRTKMTSCRVYDFDICRDCAAHELAAASAAEAVAGSVRTGADM